MTEIQMDDGVVLAAERDDSLRWQLVVENPQWNPALAVDPWGHPSRVPAAKTLLACQRMG